MINVRRLRNLKENDGMTLKKGKLVRFKTGYQVATEGVECKTPEEAIKAVRAYEGNCGVWLEKGIFYVDRSRRVSTKREALEVGRQCNQISVLRWSNLSLIYC